MTDIIFSFDTEDFTSKNAADAILTEAEILWSEGVRGCFCLVGLLARQLMSWKRSDVLAALSHHEIELHSFGHTLHPTINEYTDVADFNEAEREVLRQEEMALRYIKAATGVDQVFAAVPPGNQKSYAAMYAYADMGIPIYADTFCDPEDGSGAFYCDMYHVDYSLCMEDIFFEAGEAELCSALDGLAKRKRAVIYTHPHFSMFSEHWDAVNYNRENRCRFGEWIEAPRRDPADTGRFYENLRTIVKLVRDDPRFRIITFADIAAELGKRPVRVISRGDMPWLDLWLSKGLAPTAGEMSLSVADMYQACRALLRGEEKHICGRTKGFLEAPRGISQSVSLRAEDIRASAFTLGDGGFIPPEIWVGGKAIGPGDWLRAAVKVLCGGDTAKVEPGEQNVCLDVLPKVRDCAFEGTWCHSKDFKDRYLSDRLRLQNWTLRY